jgi:hypothetical protein
MERMGLRRSIGNYYEEMDESGPGYAIRTGPEVNPDKNRTPVNKK